MALQRVMLHRPRLFSCHLLLSTPLFLFVWIRWNWLFPLGLKAFPILYNNYNPITISMYLLHCLLFTIFIIFLIDKWTLNTTITFNRAYKKIDFCDNLILFFYNAINKKSLVPFTRFPSIFHSLTAKYMNLFIVKF